MEKLFEKILHEMRSRISFLLAFVVSLIVFIMDPKGVFHFIFESIFQYTQNKILSFSLSFFFIFFFFYSFFFIVGKVYRWCEVKKYEQDLIDQKIALKIHQFPDKIKKELYECYSKKQNKIPRTDELDRLIGRLDLIGFFKLRNFFEPTESDYIVKPDVLRAIKKYHKIAFKSIYWQQNK
ncbi:hypothetical protein KVD85_07650 [Helicobacter pylori]|uniref:hypothetical protein n=1 Tax=Helicobacter pylori TaxID=210 RepID=UPI000BE9BF64|nr:hypothetical protein [Helicobacter pylori]PDW38965.1 hypothetical protein BB425_00445 [Helicobacter pylori]RPF65717.1 hypothetical protein EGV98_00450 [Helicobacter pylori]WQU53502.1 hypothetical protein KVD85_07650 [Helicobacter pylori]